LIPGVVDDLRMRIRNTQLPDRALGQAVAQGTGRDWPEGMPRYWAEEFDWQARERELNRFVHYRAEIGGAGVPRPGKPSRGRVW
jgi:hypothetical protein